ncbi:MAG: thiamine phosphate synthase [Campylobacterota bacterium]|nr:thiamine phosphate synthase [Campylobacterota bacterium]
MISYAITDPSTLYFERLDDDLKRISQKAEMIVYRDKENDMYEAFAEQFIGQAKNCSFEKILLHGSVDLASKLGADGVHLASTQFDEIAKAKQNDLLVVISCHTVDEAKKAEALGADMITYSPIFMTPNKGRPLGLGALKEIQGIISLPIIALGGILTQEQIDACCEAGASGFASIRFFN